MDTRCPVAQNSAQSKPKELAGAASGKVSSRRQFLELGIAATLLPAVISGRAYGAPLGLPARRLNPLHRVVYDGRYPACVAFAEWMREHDVPIRELDDGT